MKNKELNISIADTATIHLPSIAISSLLITISKNSEISILARQEENYFTIQVSQFVTLLLVYQLIIISQSNNRTVSATCWEIF